MCFSTPACIAFNYTAQAICSLHQPGSASPDGRSVNHISPSGPTSVAIVFAEHLLKHTSSFFWCVCVCVFACLSFLSLCGLRSRILARLAFVPLSMAAWFTFAISCIRVFFFPNKKKVWSCVSQLQGNPLQLVKFSDSWWEGARCSVWPMGDLEQIEVNTHSAVGSYGCCQPMVSVHSQNLMSFSASVVYIGIWVV